MLKSLTLHNFRTHKDTEVVFSSGVNIVIGVSGSGKTNILRALNWITNNRPLGDSLIKWGEDTAQVSLVVQDRKKEIGILRHKQGSKNEYVLVPPEGDEITFTAFGSNVPPQVSEILNLSDINIQKQFEPYFLVFDSPGEIASYVRTITKLDEIDVVSDAISSKIRMVKGEAQEKESELDSITLQLEELSRIELNRLEQLINDSEATIKVQEEIRKSSQELSGIIQQLKEIEDKYIYFPENINQVVEDIQKKIFVFQELKGKENELLSIITELKRVESESIILPDNLDEILSKEKVVDEYNNIRIKIEDISDTLNKIIVIKVESENLQTLISHLEVEKQELMQQLTICPSCGQELDEEAKKVLLGENK
jgi:DNA repair protein SbcC/Rad50